VKDREGVIDVTS